MITRRKMLAIGGFALAVSAAPLILKHCGKDDDKWDFLKSPQKDGLKSKCYEELIKTSVALDAERPIYADSLELRQFMELSRPHMEQEMRRQKMDLQASHTLDATVQNYGEPEDPRLAEHLLDYCKNAIKYMNTRLSGLENPQINWTIIKQGANHEKDFYCRGYAGQSIYSIRRLCAKDRSGKQALVTHCIREYGGTFEFRADFDKASLNWWYLFLGTGPLSIVAAFAEPLVCTTVKSSLKSVKELGLENAFFADETIHESLSHILALDAAKEFGIPGGAELVNLQIQTLPSNPFYSGMPKAITWARKNGMQNALDLYMESPKKYMDAIKSA